MGSRPITSRDRFYATITGAFGGFWILLIGRIGLGEAPVGLDMGPNRGHGLHFIAEINLPFWFAAYTRRE